MNDTEALMKAVLSADADSRNRALKALEGGAADALPDPLLTISQLCQRLQVSRATLWRWRLPCIGRGGVRRYRWSEVLAAIGKSNQPATGGAMK